MLSHTKTSINNKEPQTLYLKCLCVTSLDILKLYANIMYLLQIKHNYVADNSYKTFKNRVVAKFCKSFFPQA